MKQRQTMLRQSVTTYQLLPANNQWLKFSQTFKAALEDHPSMYPHELPSVFHIPHQLLTACICPSTTPLFHQRIPKPAQPLSPWLSKFCLFNML